MHTHRRFAREEPCFFALRSRVVLLVSSVFVRSTVHRLSTRRSPMMMLSQIHFPTNCYSVSCWRLHSLLTHLIPRCMMCACCTFLSLIHYVLARSVSYRRANDGCVVFVHACAITVTSTCTHSRYCQGLICSFLWIVSLYSRLLWACGLASGRCYAVADSSSSAIFTRSSAQPLPS